jgi:hypothetical protein
MFIFYCGQPLIFTRGTVFTGIRTLRIRHNREAKNVIQNTLETPRATASCIVLWISGVSRAWTSGRNMFSMFCFIWRFKDGGKFFKPLVNKDSKTFESAMVTKLPDMPTPMVPPRVLKN